LEVAADGAHETRLLLTLGPTTNKICRTKVWNLGLAKAQAFKVCVCVCVCIKLREIIGWKDLIHLNFHSSKSNNNSSIYIPEEDSIELTYISNWDF